MPLPVLTPPDQLTSIPNWVGWKLEVKEGDTKPSKVPYNLKTGYRSASNDPNTWLTYEEACRRYAPQYNGIGFVFTKQLGIAGIDFDDCILPDGSIKPQASKYLDRLRTYMEISPSGHGIKVWAYATIPDKGIKVCFAADGRRVKDKNDPDYDHAIEVYDTLRYFAVTGNPVGDAEENVNPYPELILELYEWLRSVPLVAKPEPQPEKFSTTSRKGWPGPSSGTPVTEGSRHEFLKFQAGRFRNWLGDEDLRQALHAENRNRCVPPKPDKEVEDLVRYFILKPVGHSFTEAEIAAYRRDPARDQWSSSSNGHAASQVNGPDILTAEPEQEEIPISQQDSLEILNQLVDELIEKRDSLFLYADIKTAEPRPYMVALARAGDVIQGRVKAQLDKAFGKEFIKDRWNKELREQVRLYEKDQRENGPPQKYILTEKGNLIANTANAITMMQELPLAWNAFTYTAFLTSESPWGTSGEWSDYDDIKASEWCQRQYLNIDKGIAGDAAEAIARSRRPWFHPIVTYLEGLQWDGVKRLDMWLANYFSVPMNTYTMEVAAKWMISAVKRVCEPGCQADYTLVFEGSQGKKKSSGLGVLCGREWFADEISQVGTKDSAMQLQGKWIVEINELDAFNKAESNTIKAWLVRRNDHFRPPYGRRVQDFPRQNVFAASTNRTDWGKDETGLRRFWPVTAGRVDIEGLAAARNDLWAEAYHRYKSKESSYLSDNTEVMAVEQQSLRQETHAWRDLIREWVAEPKPKPVQQRYGEPYTPPPPIKSEFGKVYLPEILEHCLGIDVLHWNKVNKDNVSRILRLEGYVCKRESSGDRKEYWTPMARIQ